MLQLFNNIILIIHYLGFVVLNALFFWFKAARPLIYQPHVVSCYLQEKEETPGSHILSFSDPLGILNPFIWRNKLYPTDLISTVYGPYTGEQKIFFGGFLRSRFVSRPAQLWENRSETVSPSPFLFLSCLLCWIAQIPFQKAQLFPCKSRSIPSQNSNVVILHGTKFSLARY